MLRPGRQTGEKWKQPIRALHAERVSLWVTGWALYFVAIVGWAVWIVVTPRTEEGHFRGAVPVGAVMALITVVAPNLLGLSHHWTPPPHPARLPLLVLGVVLGLLGTFGYSVVYFFAPPEAEDSWRTPVLAALGALVALAASAFVLWLSVNI
jgi:uncharacterized BrkB/YihY/UPF0761 family membrane protein